MAFSRSIMEMCMSSRRSFMQSALGWGAGIIASAKAFASPQPQQHSMQTGVSEHAHPKKGSGQRSDRPLQVESPDVPQLPWQMVDGVKEFHLVAEPVRRKIAPGKTLDFWGFNGSVPGPTIQV